jgi:hypothetical protein
VPPTGWVSMLPFVFKGTSTVAVGKEQRNI